jgi:hypothetical protein
MLNRDRHDNELGLYYLLLPATGLSYRWIGAVSIYVPSADWGTGERPAWHD